MAPSAAPSRGSNLVLGLLIMVALSTPSPSSAAVSRIYMTTGVARDDNLSGIQMPGYMAAQQQHQGEECQPRASPPAGARRGLLEEQMKQQVRIDLKHRDSVSSKASPKSLLIQALKRDTARLVAFNKTINSKARRSSAAKTSSLIPGGAEQLQAKPDSPQRWELESTVESGASLGSGEYFMDAFLGSPPTHFSLIIDTGSDLTWVQCNPCEDCFPQEGPVFNPSRSASYKPIPCDASDCGMISPANNFSCDAQNAQSCRYFYSYGDSSNTTGDLAYEAMLLNLGGKRGAIEISDVIFGCGHANKGLFRGAGGLLGLGQGGLSFTSQLRSSILGQKFSYCLVDRNSNLSVTSTISFGDEFAISRHLDSLQFTPFLKTPNCVDTFYYLDIQSLIVGGETLSIPSEKFRIAQDGNGGTIIDSGTTLTYIDRDAYKTLEQAFLSRIEYPRAQAFEVLDVCYNLSAIATAAKFPEFRIVFGNGATMELPQSNYFIQPDPNEPVQCLAILPTTGLSIIGNFQQQNFHLLYDCENSRLGFAPTNCASL